MKSRQTRPNVRCSFNLISGRPLPGAAAAAASVVAADAAGADVGAAAATAAAAGGVAVAAAAGGCGGIRTGVGPAGATAATSAVPAATSCRELKTLIIHPVFTPFTLKFFPPHPLTPQFPLHIHNPQFKRKCQTLVVTLSALASSRSSTMSCASTSSGSAARFFAVLRNLGQKRR